MNKTTILTLLTGSVLGIGLITASNNVNAATNKSVAVKTYNIVKKHGKYQIDGTKTKYVTNKLVKDKTVIVNGDKYYYSNNIKSFTTAFEISDTNEKLSKIKKKSNNKNISGPTNIKTIGGIKDDHNDNKPDKIANGYNYTKDEVTDFNQYCQVFQQTALNTINKFRQEHGVPPLAEDPTLDKIAMQRAQQNYELRNSSWFDGHHDQDGIAFVDKVAVQDGLYISVNESETHLAENSTTGSINESAILQDPVTAAKGSVNDNIIEGPGGGHYQNMMDPTSIKMGIGIYVGPNHGQQTAGGEDEVYSN